MTNDTSTVRGYAPSGCKGTNNFFSALRFPFSKNIYLTIFYDCGVFIRQNKRDGGAETKRAAAEKITATAEKL